MDDSKTPNHSSPSNSRVELSRRRLLSAAAAGIVSTRIPGTPRTIAAADSRSTLDRAAAPHGQPERLPAGTGGIASAADYRRADHLWEITGNKVFHDHVEPHWLADGRFWFASRLAGGNLEYILVNPDTGHRGPAFDHARLAAALSKATGKMPNPGQLHLFIVDLSAPDTIEFNALGHGWRCNLATWQLGRHKLFAIPPIHPAFTPGDPNRWGPRNLFSPDGEWEVRIENQNVALLNRRTNAHRKITTDGKPDHFYSPQVFWSPDSTHFAVIRVQPGSDRHVYEVQWAPPGTIDCNLVDFKYLKAGDPVSIHKPAIFNASTGRQVPIKDDLFANPWANTQWCWEPDSRRFRFVFNQRGHQVMRVIAIDIPSGRAHPIIDEDCATNGREFFDYSGKFFTWYLDHSHEMIWMSERDGWNHLYLIDTLHGRVKNQITTGDWVVRGVEHVDTVNRRIWFRAGGIIPGQDPYFVHFCRVDFDGRNLTVLTRGDGTHSVLYSPDRKYLIDRFSRVDLPPQINLRRTHDGSLVCPLERADASALLKAGIPRPERFVAKGRDGVTDIYGIIIRPSHFDPSRAYPIVEDIYAGPQGAFVPKAWEPFYWPQTVAELGFIVVKMDGMGTSNRSKAFHNVCWKNLGDSGFPDRIAWIKTAAAKYPYMDTSRVGIYGTSAGGQSALRALLAHGDFYKVAVANSGCHDNRVDKIWWNEQWMSWPVGPWYAQQSNATNAEKLKGKLLLIVGGLDHNVDPACTFQVVEQLMRHNRDFQIQVFPNGHHGCGGPYWNYMWRLTRNFLVRHLWNIEPPLV